MVECFCHQCNDVLCEECLFEFHADHDVEDIKDAAEKGRERLEQYQSKLKSNFINTSIMGEIQTSQKKLKYVQLEVKNQIKMVKAVWAVLEM